MRSLFCLICQQLFDHISCNFKLLTSLRASSAELKTMDPAASLQNNPDAHGSLLQCSLNPLLGNQ